MGKRKSLVSLFLVVVLILGMSLAGCQKDKVDNANTGSTTTSTVEAASTAKVDPISELKQATVKWYVFEFAPQNGQTEVFAEINKILNEKIKTTVDIQTLPFADYETKMQVIIGSGEDYDMCFSAPWYNNYAQNVSKGAFLPLDELLPVYAPDRWKAMEKYWDATRVNGKIYGFLNEQIFARTAIVAVTKSIADKYDFMGTYKNNDFDSIEAFISKVRADDPKKFAAFGYNDNPETFNMEFLNGWLSPAAVLLTDETLTVKNYFKTPEFMRFVETARAWDKKGHLNSKELLAGLKLPAKHDDRLFLTNGGAYKPGVEAEWLKKDPPIVVVPLATPYNTTSGTIATMTAINVNSKNPANAIAALNVISSDAKVANLLYFGIEGVDYKVTDGFVDKSEFKDRYNPQLDWMYGNQFLAMPLVGQPKDVWEQTKKLNDEAPNSKAFGFTFDSTPVKNESAKCSAVITEYKELLGYGRLDDAKYQEFLDKLDLAGAEAIIVEAQRQINEWKNAK